MCTCTNFYSNQKHSNTPVYPTWANNRDLLQSWTKVLGHFCISRLFSNSHKSNTPPFTPQTMWDACIQNFFRVSTLYRVGGGRTARKFRKGCTVLRGNREMTEKYEYCSTVPRTFVQDCRILVLGRKVCFLHFSYAF